MSTPIDKETILLYAKADQDAATIIAALGGSLVPISIVFVLFSTQRSRSHPIFWIQCTALFLAISAAAVELASYGIDSRRGYDTSPAYLWTQFTKELLKWIVPWISDCALSLRLLAVYPPTLNTPFERITVMAFPVLIKVPRLVMIIYNIALIGQVTAAGGLNWYPSTKYQLAEFVLQVADGMYVSAFLLLRAYRFAYATSKFAMYGSRKQRWFRYLVEGVVMSFVPAVLLQCVAMALLATIIARNGDSRHLNIPQSVLFNIHVYLTTICSILATSWSSICNTATANRITSKAPNKLRFSPVKYPHCSNVEVEKGYSSANYARRGYDAGQPAEEQTLLYQLTHNDVLEANAANFYFADDGHHHSALRKRATNVKSISDSSEITRVMPIGSLFLLNNDGQEELCECLRNDVDGSAPMTSSSSGDSDKRFLSH